MNYYVLFGPPGAGKGTQAKLIVKKYNYIHISTGELLRQEIDQKTELGESAKQYINKGNLVPDEIVEKMIRKEIIDNPQAKGFILDGFPRTIAQAEALDEMLAELGGKINAVLSITFDDKLIFKRIFHRAEIEGRKDDTTRAIIENRIANYHEKTEPLIEYYKKKGNYYEIEGDDSIENVFSNISKLIK